MIDPQSAALIMIDMQQGFIDERSPLCIAGARETIPACARVLDAARTMGSLIVHIRRAYRTDGSDIEACRFDAWAAGGKPLSEAWPETLSAPAKLVPAEGETVIVKPRFSAFFGTGLDLMLRRMRIATVVLIGTTTPNCIRSTCYDALSLGYNVVVVQDATSSRTPEVQRANIEDMSFIGAQIITSQELAVSGLASVIDIEASVMQAQASLRTL